MAPLRTGNPRGKTHKRPTGRPPTKRQAAIIWLRNYLSRGPRSASEIEAVGAGEGYGWTLLKECKTELGISSTRVGHEWHWQLRDLSQPPEPTLAEPAVPTQSADELWDVSTAAPGATATVEPDTLPFPAWSDHAFDQVELLKVTDYSDLLIRIYNDEESPYDKRDVAQEIARCKWWAERKAKALPPRTKALEPDSLPKPENPGRDSESNRHTASAAFKSR